MKAFGQRFTIVSYVTRMKFYLTVTLQPSCTCHHPYFTPALPTSLWRNHLDYYKLGVVLVAPELGPIAEHAAPETVGADMEHLGIIRSSLVLANVAIGMRRCAVCLEHLCLAHRTITRFAHV
jgi:hypothetical protein